MRARDAEVDAPGIRERHELGDDLARELIEPHGHALRYRPRLLAGEREQLLDESDGALHAGGEPLRGRGALGFAARPRQHAHLKMQRREGRAQLVCGIRHERPLALERRVQPREEVVQRGGERAHLVGERGVGERLEGVDAARLHQRGEPLQGLERAPDREPDQQRQPGKQQREGLERLERELDGALPAHAHRLRHLDDLGERLHAEHPPGTPAGGDGGEAECDDAGQHGVRARLIHPHAIERPDLDHEVVGGIGARNLRREQILHGLIAQDERGLPQVIVEERVGLDEGVAIDDPAAGGADEHDARHEPGEEPRPERGHGAGLTR